MKAIAKILDFGLIIYAIFYLSLFVTDYSFVLTKPVSNISAPTGIFLGIIFLRFLVHMDNFKDSPVIRAVASFPGINERKFISWAVFLTFIFFAALAIARHFSLGSSSFDLGIFDQAIWNSLHGKILFSSLKNNINLLGDHFGPILLIFVPVYKLFPSPLVLLVAQSLLLSIAIIPLYLIAREILKNNALTFAFVISYTLSRPLRGVMFSDFHPECFVVPALFAAYYFLIKRKNFGLWTSLIIVLLCKEDMAFIVSAFGIFTVIFEKRIKLGLSLVVIGILAWALETKIIIPHFNPDNVYPYMNRLPFGMTYADNVKTIIANPEIMGKIFFMKGKVAYCIKIFGPLGFLSLFSPPHYILFGIPLVRNLLPVDQNFSGWYSVSSHYTASLIPFVYIAAIYGVRKVEGKIKHAWLVTVIIILCSLFFYGKTDAYKFSRYIKTIRWKHTLSRISYMDIIPPEASVAANFNLVPHLTSRRYTFEWNPRNIRSFSAEYLAIDLTMLDYLSPEDKISMPRYFKEIQKNGYVKIFENKEKDFLILHNSNFDKRKVEETVRSQEVVF